MFHSREDAGSKLGRALQAQGVRADVVLGLPRGGVVVAAGVAKELGLPLGALVVRKIGHPRQREFAVGALAEHGVLLLDPNAVGSDPSLQAGLEEVIREEKARLRAYETIFHSKGAPELRSKTVLLIDDGLATGATAEAATRAAQKARARAVLVAAPVGSRDAVERLARVADEVRVLQVDPAFAAVGQYYERFEQTTDDEVEALLEVGNVKRDA